MAYEAYRQSAMHPISDVLQRALIAAEDWRFFSHGGVDFRALARAAYRNAALRVREGGSTIEQQLVRQITGRRERTVARKVREILIACLVERVIPKIDIPGVYLSVAHFGWQMTGLHQACRRLGVDSAAPTYREAASLMARLKYPEPRIASSDRSLQIVRRVEYILRRCGSSQDAGPSPGLSSSHVEVEQGAALPDSGLILPPR
jgi:membrane peptidoglycan carboxypeptidase